MDLLAEGSGLIFLPSILHTNGGLCAGKPCALCTMNFDRRSSPQVGGQSGKWPASKAVRAARQLERVAVVRLSHDLAAQPLLRLHLRAR